VRRKICCTGQTKQSIQETPTAVHNRIVQTNAQMRRHLSPVFLFCSSLCSLRAKSGKNDKALIQIGFRFFIMHHQGAVLRKTGIFHVGIPNIRRPGLATRGSLLMKPVRHPLWRCGKQGFRAAIGGT